MQTENDNTPVVSTGTTPKNTVAVARTPRRALAAQRLADGLPVAGLAQAAPPNIYGGGIIDLNNLDIMTDRHITGMANWTGNELRKKPEASVFALPMTLLRFPSVPVLVITGRHPRTEELRQGEAGQIAESHGKRISFVARFYYEEPYDEESGMLLVGTVGTEPDTVAEDVYAVLCVAQINGIENVALHRFENGNAMYMIEMGSLA